MMNVVKTIVLEKNLFQDNSGAGIVTAFQLQRWTGSMWNAKGIQYSYL